MGRQRKHVTATDVPVRPSIRTSALSRLAAPLFIAVVVQSVANLLFHAVVGRALQPAEYGALGTVLAAMTLVAVPLSALQTASARATATDGLSRATALSLTVRTVAYSAPVVALLLLAAKPVAAFLHLDSAWDAAILAPTLLVAALIAVIRGLLLGVGRTSVVAGSYIVATAVRLGPGLALAYFAGVTGALLGTLLGELCGLLLVMIAALRAGQGPRARVSGSDYLRTGAVVSGLFLFTTVDLFLARHFLPASASGGYVAAATIGKTVLALPAAAISIAYPKLVSGWTTGRGTAALRSSLLVVGVPAILAALFVALVPGFVLAVLFGAGTYSDATSVTRVLALVAGLSAFVSVLVHAGLARRAWTAWLPWAGAAGEILLISMWHNSATLIAAGSAIAAVAVIALLVAFEIPAWKSNRNADSALPSA
jgi:O-antigen/teichoic acid export membrane protein